MSLNIIIPVLTLFLIDLIDKKITGKDTDAALGNAYITVNKNTVPKENRSPFITSGLRVGTPAVTSRGMGEADMRDIARLMHETYEANGDATKEAEIRMQVQAIAAKFPLYPQWASV